MKNVRCEFLYCDMSPFEVFLLRHGFFCVAEKKEKGTIGKKTPWEKTLLLIQVVSKNQLRMCPYKQGKLERFFEGRLLSIYESLLLYHSFRISRDLTNLQEGFCDETGEEEYE